MLVLVVNCRYDDCIQLKFHVFYRSYFHSYVIILEGEIKTIVAGDLIKVVWSLNKIGFKLEKIGDNRLEILATEYENGNVFSSVFAGDDADDISECFTLIGERQNINSVVNM